jgi:Tfp pilus assembly protein PilF
VRIGVGLACLLLAVTPVLVWRSQTRIHDAVAALNAGDCPAATDAALDSADAVGVRSEPFEVLSYCNVRAGRHDLAQRSIDAALERDPRNWELHYAKALVRGAAGLDPRDAAYEALRRNPTGDLPKAAVRRFLTTEDPRVWRRRALASPLPVPPPSG